MSGSVQVHAQWQSPRTIGRSDTIRKHEAIDAPTHHCASANKCAVGSVGSEDCSWLQYKDRAAVSQWTHPSRTRLVISYPKSQSQSIHSPL